MNTINATRSARAVALLGTRCAALRESLAHEVRRRGWAARWLPGLANDGAVAVCEPVSGIERGRIDWRARDEGYACAIAFDGHRLQFEVRWGEAANTRVADAIDALVPALAVSDRRIERARDYMDAAFVMAGFERGPSDARFGWTKPSRLGAGGSGARIALRGHSPQLVTHPDVGTTQIELAIVDVNGHLVAAGPHEPLRTWLTRASYRARFHDAGTCQALAREAQRLTRLLNRAQAACPLDD